MGNCFNTLSNKNVEEPSEQPLEQPSKQPLEQPFPTKLTIEIPNESDENNAIACVN